VGQDVMEDRANTGLVCDPWIRAREEKPALRAALPCALRVVVVHLCPGWCLLPA